MMKLSTMYRQNLIDNNILERKLEDLKNTNRVYLTNLQLDDNSCLQISKFMQENDILIKLEATDGSITSRGLAHLSEAISKSKSLKTICLARNKITDIDDSSFSYFTRAISVSTTVTELDLSQNAIGFNCCQHIANLIRSNNILELLNLAQNSIPNEGCSLIIEALSFNTNLKILLLEGNGIKIHLLQKVNQLLNQNNTSKNNIISDFHKIDQNDIIASTISENYTNSKKEYSQNNRSLLTEYNKLKEEFSELKKAYDTSTKSYELTKSGFTQTLEKERSLRISKEKELNKANTIISENQIKLNQIVEKQKCDFENLRVQLEAELIEKCEENTRLTEINSNYEHLFREQQFKNESIGQDQFIKIEEFKQKINNIKKEYLNSRSELVKQLEQDKNKIAQDELDQIKLKNQNDDWERKYNYLVKKSNMKGIIEKRAQEDLKNKMKEIKAKNNELETIINNNSTELLSKDEEIIKLKKKYDYDVIELQSNLSKMDSQKSQKIIEQSKRICQLEDALTKLKLNFNEEKIKLVNDENSKFTTAEDLFNRRYNEALLRCDELEKGRAKLEEEIDKLKKQIVCQKAQFENDKTGIIQQSELKYNQSNLGRESMLLKNKELLVEIESMKLKLTNHELLKEEVKSLKGENLSIRSALENSRIQIVNFEKELIDKTNILNQYKMDLDAMTLENQKIKADLLLSSQSVNNVNEIQIAFSNLQQQYNELQAQLLLHQNEYTNERTYSNSLIDFPEANVQYFPPTIMPQIIKDKTQIENQGEPVTEYRRKIVKSPNSKFTSCPSPKFNSSIK